jgi:hypothetical protein
MSCGAEVLEDDRHEVRRTVTILFSDVAGSRSQLVHGAHDAFHGPVADLLAVARPRRHSVPEVEAHVDTRKRVLVGRLGEAREVTKGRRLIAAPLTFRQGEAADGEVHPVRMGRTVSGPAPRPSFDGVPGVVVRDGRSLHQRRPRRVGDRRRVAVDLGETDGGDRSPEAVVVLGVPGADVAIRQGYVQQAEQPGVLPEIEPF